MTNDACSEARNSTQSATSRGVPNRLNGEAASYSRRRAAGSSARSRNESVNGVSMIPGQTQFTRTPRGATSSASERVNWRSAPFDVVYGVSFGHAMNELIDAMFTIAPPDGM